MAFNASTASSSDPRPLKPFSAVPCRQRVGLVFTDNHLSLAGHAITTTLSLRCDCGEEVDNNLRQRVPSECLWTKLTSPVCPSAETGIGIRSQSLANHCQPGHGNRIIAPAFPRFQGPDGGVLEKPVLGCTIYEEGRHPFPAAVHQYYLIADSA